MASGLGWWDKHSFFFPSFPRPFFFFLRVATFELLYVVFLNILVYYGFTLLSIYDIPNLGPVARI